MNKLDVPFNISLLILNEENTRMLRPIKVLDVFDGVSKNFHPDGLYSTKTFGIIGSEARYAKMSYIDLKVSIIHPTIYKALVQTKALYEGIIFGKEFAVWDNETSDFVKSNALEGHTGYSFFIENWKQIEFVKNDSNKRELNINLITEAKKNAELDKYVVIPAGYRDIEIDDNGRESSNEINALYYKMLAISNTIDSKVAKMSPSAYDAQRASLQRVGNEIYDMLTLIIEGKKNLLMGKWASRKIFNGTRNVITSMNVSSPYLGNPHNVNCNNTAVGIYQYMKANLPVAKYKLMNGFLSSVFTSVGSAVFLVNKETLMSEKVYLKSDEYDRWMTNEGIEKLITKFKENSVRHEPIQIDSRYYLGLIYLGPDNTFKLIRGIDELPEKRLKEHCFPITLTHLFYCSVYDNANKYPIYVTRYPITGIGSIYASMVFLRSTVKSEVRQELGDDWKPLGPDRIAYQFPTETDFFNSAAPHSSKLGALNADFDGDTASGNIVSSDEAVEEIQRFIHSRNAYVGSSGKFISSLKTDTAAYVLKNLTGG